MAKKQRSELHNVHTMAIFQSKVRTKSFTILEALKKVIVREWTKIPASHIRAACDSFLGRLKDIVKAKGSHIEQK